MLWETQEGCLFNPALSTIVHLSGTSFNCYLVWVINLFIFLCVCSLGKLKLSPPTRLMPSQWQRNLENVFPIWGTPSTISSDWGAHFTEQIIHTLEFLARGSLGKGVTLGYLLAGQGSVCAVTSSSWFGSWETQ